VSLFIANPSGQELPYQWGGQSFTVPAYASECPDDSRGMHAVGKFPAYNLSWHASQEEAEEALRLKRFADFYSTGLDPLAAAEAAGYKRSEGELLLGRAINAGYTVKRG
jgi:hypothetical protein